MADSKGASKDSSDPGQITDVIDLVKTYARQETVGPLKGIGRKIAAGVAGALLIGIGLFFLALGALRFLQSKVSWATSGAFTWAAYLIVLIFCVVVSATALWRIKKLGKELS